MTWIRSLLVVACLGVAVLSYPLAEDLIAEENDGDYQYDEVEAKPEDAVKRGDIAGSGAEPGKKDEVKPVAADTSKVVDNPESDESESPASGDAAVSSGASEELEDADATTRDGVTDPADQEDAGSAEEGSGAENEIVKKDKVASKRDKEEKDEGGCKKCECEEDEPDEEHEHHHEHCGHENCCHGDHEDEHHHDHDQGHHEHEDCCHHHGHHHGFVHEWGEECCGDHDSHDHCGEHEHCHHDADDHHHEHCCHDKHCCHHKEEEEEPHHCCCDRRSKTAGKEKEKKAKSKRTIVPEQEAPVAQVSPNVVKKQTVHVGYGYASGDNYRLGYQQGGMGGLASTFTGQIGAEQQGSYDADHFNKRRTVSYQPRGPVRQKRFYGGHAFGNMESGMAHGSATPYGHPVTHPGFTTMGFPGHALASQDVRNTIIHPHIKRSIIYDEAIPYEAIPYPYAIHYRSPY